jgi:hypothetical protein
MRCLDLSTGYADAMSKGFFIPYGAGLVVVYYSAVALIMFAAFSAAALQCWRLPALLSLLFSLFVCAVSVKHGMGGNQIEQSLAVLAAVLWFVCLLLIMPTSGNADQGKNRWRRFGLATAMTALLLLSVVGAKTNFPIVNLRQSLAEMRGNASLLALTLRGETTDRWNETLAKAHKFWQPTDVLGSRTIDVYPQHTGVVIGREGFNYTPRPAFLSLNAHTYELSKLNAHHLEASTSPEIILFQVLPSELAVNNRHPALADGPSWPLLLSRYTPENSGNEFLLLKKRLMPLSMARKLLLDISLKMGETVNLPQSAGNLFWTEVEVDRSLTGNIFHALYKSPHVLLESRMADNATHIFQIVPELGRAGFLMSPLVQNNAAFAELYSGRTMVRDIVRSITINSPEAPDYFWKKTIRLRLWSLQIVP